MRQMDGWPGLVLARILPFLLLLFFFFFFFFLLLLLLLFGLFGLLYSPLYGLLAVLLVFLPPLIPAIGRVREEVPAYAMSTAVLIADLESAGLVMDTEKVRHDEAVARARTLLGNGYFWPALLLGKKFEEDVARDIQVLSKLIPTSDDEIFRAVRTALQNAS
jgi:hypothetical protein